MQFIKCRFNDDDNEASKLYTYHSDGQEQVKVGDKVKIHTKNGDGFAIITVVELTKRPTFPTKGIIGLFRSQE